MAFTPDLKRLIEISDIYPKDFFLLFFFFQKKVGQNVNSGITLKS